MYTLQTSVTFLLAGFTAFISGTLGCQDKLTQCPGYTSYCGVADIKAACPKTCGVCGRPPPGAAAQCGKPAVQLSRVIAGKNAKRGSWPWQVLLLKDNEPFCGGSIVHARWIVTASHCIDKLVSQPYRITVRVGEYNIDVNEGSERVLGVQSVFMHAGYYRLANDIAMLKLASPILFNSYVQPICLPSKDVAVGTKCYITGWGKTNPNGGVHPILQQVALPVVSNSLCASKNTKVTNVRLDSGMLCAGDGGATLKGGCQGDSGGPFVCEVGGRWELHGAVSHGADSCSSKEAYTVFARITQYLGWIKNNIDRYNA